MPPTSALASDDASLQPHSRDYQPVNSLSSATVAPNTSFCRLKTCKKVKKSTPEDAALHACVNEGCAHSIHAACLTALHAEIKNGDGSSEPVCGKRCFNAVAKRSRAIPVDVPAVKKRVAWHNDGVAGSSISSLSCLLDWMTADGNYSRYKGGDGQTGETKMAIAGEVLRFIERSGVPTTRSAKDIMTKISALEASYKNACDWANCTGQGIQEEATIRAEILKRCPQYDELSPLMAERPSTKPLSLNTDDISDWSENSSDDTSSSGDEESKTDGEPESMRGSSVSVGTKRPLTIPLSVATGTTKRGRGSASTSSETQFADLKAAQLQQDREFECRKMKIQERQVRLQEDELLLRKSEATAHAHKLQQEAEHWRIQRTVLLLRERKKLIDEGVSEEEVNALLPVPNVTSL